MTKPHYLVSIIAVSFCSISVLAEPSSILSSIRMTQWGPSGLVGVQFPFEEKKVNPNSQITLNPEDPSWGPPIYVSYDVETIGWQRHILVTFESNNGDPMFNQSLIDTFEPDDDEHKYQTEFTVGLLSDPEWNRDPAQVRYALLGDGITLKEYNLQSDSEFKGLVTYIFPSKDSPAAPGSFGADVVADRFEVEMIYNIPEPGMFGIVSVALSMMLRRR